MNTKKFLFVAGAPRSGTSAFVDLLNCNRKLLICNERYSHLALRNQLVSPTHFTSARLLQYEAGDTYHNATERDAHRALVADRFETAEYVGDKIPRLYERLDTIAREFEESTLLFLVRNIFDVALSYKTRAQNVHDTRWPQRQGVRVAVKDWNNALRLGLRAVSEFRNIDAVLLDYEKFFFQDHCFFALMDRLGVEQSPSDYDLAHQAGIYSATRTIEQSRGNGLSSQEKAYICANAEFTIYRALHAVGEWVT